MGLAAGTRLGPYEIAAVVGAGGMGEVYRARDTRLRRDVAIKVLPATLGDAGTARDRFRQEALAVAALQHPNICTIYDVGEAPDGHAFLVMELLQGETLEQRLGRGPLDVPLLLDVGIALADALESAHGKGIIHRDIKPANIFLTDRGPKILDFGVAKTAAPAVSAASSTRTDVASPLLTSPGSTVGTAAYMSPEQLRGEALDPRSDLFSLGLVLYEMATGRRAFPGATSAVVAAAILHQHPPPPSLARRDLPAQLDGVIFKALEKDRALRYGHAADVRVDLERLRRTAVPGPVASFVKDGTSAKSRRWVVPALIAAGLLATAAAATFYFRPQAPAAPDRAAAGQALVLADFVNTTGDPVFDGTLRQGLAVQLRQSQVLSLISDDRLQQTLRLMGQPADTPLTPALARQACERTGSGGVLEGSIARLGSKYVLGLTARSCQSGEVLAEEQVQADRKEEVLDALNRIAGAFRTRIGESLAADPRLNIAIADASTASLEAWKAYSTGLNTMLRTGCADGLPHYMRAIEIDKQFAMVHANLGLCYSILGEAALAAASTTRAYELRERVTAPEKFFITATYHRQVTGNLEEAQRTFESWAQAYPRDATPHGLSSGFTYQGTGRYERSIQEARAAIALAPDSPPAYANLTFSHVYLGRADDAEMALRLASERRVDSFDVQLARYAVAVLRNDADAIEQLAARVAATPRAEDLVVHLESLTLARSGQLQAARKLASRAASLAEQQGRRERAAVFRAGTAAWEALVGSKAAARASALDALSRSSGRDSVYGAAFALALAGDEARADTLAKDLASRYPDDTSVQWLYLPTLEALAALKRGKPADAVARLEPVEPHDIALPATGFVGFFGSLYSAYVRGEAYRALKQYDKAAAEFRKVIEHRGLVLCDPVDAAARLQLARVLAASNNTAGARRAYQDLLTLWQDADGEAPLVAQAKTEAARLR